MKQPTSTVVKMRRPGRGGHGVRRRNAWGEPYAYADYTEASRREHAAGLHPTGDITGCVDCRSGVAS